MKRTITIVLSVVMTLSLCGPAFAAPDPEKTEESYPVLGSWYLDQEFYKISDESMIPLSLDETQSIYGSGGIVYTFDEDGTAHEMIYESLDGTDTSAKWESSSPDVYHYTDENDWETEFHYDAGEDALHRYEFKDEQNADSPDWDFVYVRAITGSWQLDRVVQITEETDEAEETDKSEAADQSQPEAGDEEESTQVILPKEENQSLYAEEENIYTFDAGGEGLETVHDGPDMEENRFTWMTTGPDAYTFFDPEDENSLEEEPELQGRLQELGYLDASPQENIKTAVKVFQMFNGLEITGIADDRTKEVLLGTNAQGFFILEYGRSGDQVSALQQLLQEKGYLDDEPDGNFGNLTKNAVIQFQQENGMTPDGVAGRLTCGALVSDPDTAESSEEPHAPTMVFIYLRDDDTLYRDVVTEDPDAVYPHLRFFYKRAKLTEDEEEEQPQNEWVPAEMPETPQIDLPVYSEPPAEEESQISEPGEDVPARTPEL